MDIPLDADVYCDDGFGGRSTCIILNPHKRQVTHLIVAEVSPRHTERLVPINQVAAITPYPVRLLCSKYELSQMRPFVASELVETDVPYYVNSGIMNIVTDQIQEHRWMNVDYKAIPPGALALPAGVQAVARDHPVGTVAGLIVDDISWLINYLVLHTEHLMGDRDVLISVSHLTKIEPNKVCLNINARNIAALPAVPVKH